jgi:hypothetical protein
MISRRAPRSAKPAEQLQQLSLNNSLGIDATKAPTDVRSALSMKNFVVNLDGSLSLRKPVILKNNFGSSVKKVIPLGTQGACLAIGTWNGVSGFLILDEELKSVPYTLVWHTYKDIRRTHAVGANVVFPESIINMLDCEYTSTPTSTVFGNCLFKLSEVSFPGMESTESPVDLVNVSLYDSNGDTVVVGYRLLQVYYAGVQGWTIQIVTPGTNVYSVQDDASVTHPADALLDNPYAVRDVYGSSVPSVKLIRKYVPSSKQAGRAIPDGASSEPVDGQEVYDLNFGSTDSPSGSVSLPTMLDRRGMCYLVTSAPIYTYSRTFKGVTVSYEVHLNSVLGLQYSLGAGGVPLGLFNQTDLDFVGIRRIHVDAPTGTRVTIPTHSCEVSVKCNLFEGSPVDDFTTTFSFEFQACELSGRTLAYTHEDVLKKDVSDQLVNYAYGVSNTYASASGTVFQKIIADAVKNSVSTVSNVWNTSVNVNTTATARFKTYPSGIPLGAVCSVTESVKSTAFRALVAESGQDEFKMFILKAFCNIPKTFEFSDGSELRCSWRYTYDGVTWGDVFSETLFAYKDVNLDVTDVTEPSDKPLQQVSTPDAGSDADAKVVFKFVKWSEQNPSPNDNVLSRADCLVLYDSDGCFNAPVFKFKVCKVLEHKVVATYAECLFYTLNATSATVEHSDVGNAAAGKKVYTKTRVFNFGHSSFKNNVFYSYPGEFTTPLTNAITLSAAADTQVTSLNPWRDYIVSSTPSALYLSSKANGGFFTKTVNTSIGVSEQDSQCVVPIPNGIVFKSGTKVCQLYPNVYADDDTVMNVTDISQGIAHILETHAHENSSSPFAFATSFEYVLMLPQEASTLCLRYDFNNRRWTSHEYAAVFDSFYMYSLDNICMYGTNAFGEYCEFMFDSGYEKLPFSNTFTRANELRYGDVLKHASAVAEGAYGTTIANTVQDLQAQFNSTYMDTISPIEFELDTGQKTDTILTTKQFVETKLVVSTNTKYDKFPMQLVVHVDGDPNIITRDVSTDSAFWKDGSTFGMLNTTFNTLSDTSDISGTLRQLVVRYSGKGKSIRHILTGSSFCNFKLYETYVRYKHPNVKQ